MLCQQCNQNPATVQFTVYINGHRDEQKLCRECHEKMGPFAVGGFPPMMSGNNSVDEILGSFFGPGNPKQMSGGQKMNPKQSVKGKRKLLDEIGRNLSDIAKAGLIDPVIGRDQEVEQMIETLNRRNKNNPVLIGEPGVGKTAIAEGLALKIAEGNVPSKLLDKEVYILDVASLVADTGIRGQFEERMKNLISELQNNPSIILFIDEVHQLVGAGSAQGSMDAGNILKPALARGDIQIIGATTLKEYRIIEKDAALERRFQPIIVEEPSPEDALLILKGIASKYEDFHEVSYSDEVLSACVNLSHRYIQDRFLPDKAIDLLDQAGSKANLASSVRDDSSVQSQLERVRNEKMEAVNKENFELAAELREKEHDLMEQLAAAPKENRTEVTVEMIQKLIEAKTKIPVGKLEAEEQNKMKNLADNLNNKVIGQDVAVSKIAKAIRRSRAGLKNANRPIGSFMFVGPTGVGKTELTKQLAEELFGDKENMIRLDMSEYMEKHSVAKLIGSPPGYVGHEEAGQLTEQVRRKPYSIILLDEIEKAHGDVQNIFLQILEDGRLTDSQGRVVSFKDTVIIATSNAGTSEKKPLRLGFGQEANKEVMNEASILEGLRLHFRPEFLNRFDAIVEFKHLEETHLVQIVDLMLSELETTLKDQNVALHVTKDAKLKIAKLGYNKEFGARPLRRTLQEHVEDQIADLLLDETDVTSVTVKIEKDKIVITK